MKICCKSWPLAAVVAVTVCFMPTQDARADLPVIDVSGLGEWVKQTANEIRQLAQQVQAYQTQLLQWQLEIQNTTNLPSNYWASVTRDIAAVTDLANQASVLTGTSGTMLGNLNTSGSYFALQQNIPQAVSSLGNYQTQMGNSLQVMGEQIGLQQSEAANTSAIIDQVSAQSSSAVGQLAAIQASTEMTQSVATELAGVQQTLNTTAQVVGTEQIAEADRQARDDAWMQTFLADPSVAPLPLTGLPAY